VPLIIFLVTKSDVGGAQKYVADLAGGLDKNRFRAEIVMGGRDLRWLTNAFRPYLLFINDWLALFELIKLFKQRRPQIVHLNSSKAGVIGALAAKIASRKIKTVFTAHGWVFNPGNHDSNLRKRFYIFLHRRAARFQDLIINVSEYDRRLALKNGIAPPNKLITIYNGLDFRNLNFLDRQPARQALTRRLAARPLPSTPDEVWIGSVGRLAREKDYPTFVEAAARIDNPKIQFFIIGAGPEKTNILNRVTARNLEQRFFLLGQIPEAARYLKAFDIFVLSSIKEGLPYTLLEALAAEIPVVATAVGGVPEIISHPQAIVPIRDPAAITRAIMTILTDPQKPEMASSQLTRVQKIFSLETMIRKTETAYQALLALNSVTQSF